MNNYELAVQNVKATLFDRVYREQGLVDIINKKLDGYSPEDQERLSFLFTKQKENIESVLGLLSEFEVKMGEILTQSEEIMAITNSNSNESSQVKENPEVAVVSTEGVEVAPVSDVVSDTTNVSEVKVSEEGAMAAESTAVVTIPVNESPSSSEPVAETNAQPVATDGNEVVIPLATVSTDNVDSKAISEPVVEVSNQVVEVPTVSENVTSDGATVTNAELPNSDSKPLVEETVVPQVVASDNAVVSSTPETAVVDDTPSVAEQHASPVVATTEIVQIPGQTSALEDDKPTTSEEFVLSPIDEGVAMSIPEIANNGIAAADNQLQAVENVKNEIASDSSLNAEQKAEMLEKYTRMTAGTIKAILVTKAQYEKLLLSRETQKALLNSKNNSQKTDEIVASTDVAVQPESVATVPLTLAAESAPTVVMAPVADSTPVVNVGSSPTSPAVVDEQTLIANGLLAPTSQDKQKEMQTMIEQANELYKAGKAQEAQELFNKVSVMNKELQTGSQGQTLVKS